MIEQNVRVVRCHDGQVWVRLGGQSGCNACESGRGCGAGLFAKLFRGKPVILVLPQNEKELVAGQMLVLGIPERLYMRLVWASYGLPLLAALGGAVAGHLMAEWIGLATVQSDMIVLMTGMLAAWVTLRQTRRRMQTGTLQNCLQSLEYRPAVGKVACAPLPLRSPLIDK